MNSSERSGGAVTVESGFRMTGFLASPRGRALLHGLLGILALLLFAASLQGLKQVPRTVVSQEMSVVLPRFVQVMMAGGDRYLAANIGMFRAMVASTDKMNPDNFAVQGQVQEDVAWFNPMHEDNYYVAAAILPWFGQVPSAQAVLQRAIPARRSFDWHPSLYYAFNIYHFDHDPARAAQLLLDAAPAVRSENDRYMLENVAAFWFEKGYDPKIAVQVIDGMAKQARSGAFRRYLQTRADRLRILLEVQGAADIFRKKFGRAPSSIEELEGAKILAEFPQDPFGFGFQLDQSGNPKLLNSPKSAK